MKMKKRVDSIWCRILSVAALSLSLSLYANDLTDNNNLQVTGEGNTIEPIGDDGALITMPASGTITLLVGQANANILAVGGGGGGGATQKVGKCPGGGGGGAGGMVEVSSITFKNGIYTITIGAGGAGGGRGNTGTPGTNGGDTKIELNGEQLADVPVAIGGGGGGSATGENESCNGNLGGSGGGGAGTAGKGGSATANQGNVGGNSSVTLVGAGGGGAGGSGSSVSSTTGAPGGDGKISDITGEYYAGGGAGGSTVGSGIGKVNGGSGGGGSGGDKSNTDSRDGENGRGGGGGGGTSAKDAGNGGSGIVIIRLSNFMKGGVPLPTIGEHTYDKTLQTAATANEYYTLSGDYQATTAGTYTITFSLTDEGKELGWDSSIGGGEEDKQLLWTIEKRSIQTPKKLDNSFTFNFKDQQGFDTDDDWYSLDENNFKRDAGTYSVTATLKDEKNTEWEKPEEINTLSWKIDQLSIAKPEKNGSEEKTYSGSAQIGYKTDLNNPRRYELIDDNVKTDAGAYTVTATLTEPNNLVWSDLGHSNARELEWSINKRTITKPTKVQDSFEYNGTERINSNPTTPTDFYSYTGNTGTTAGDYTCVVHLTHNDSNNINCVWDDGTSKDFSWDWKIEKCSVDVPEHIASFVYDEDPKDTVKTWTTFTPQSDLYQVTADSDSLTQTQAGDYQFTLKLKDESNYTWKDKDSKPILKPWKIEKNTNVITNLKIDDWQVGGTPSDPKCDTKFGDPDKEVIYEWNFNNTEWIKWSDRKPMDFGTYELRARAQDRDNWKAGDPSDKYRFCIWVHPEEVFTDYVDISNFATANKTLTIELSEPVESEGAVINGLPGYEYSRVNSTNDIRFILKGATKDKDKMLYYRVDEWDDRGTSKISVQLPAEIDPGAEVRMYWHLKEGESVKSDNHSEDVGTASSVASPTFSLVNREGMKVNYWTKAPTLKTNFENYREGIKEDDIISGLGELKEGVVDHYFINMPSKEESKEFQKSIGVHVIVFKMANDSGYSIYHGAKELEYEIIEQQSYDGNLGDTANGRVLLGNNDTMPNNAVTGQAYWQTESDHEGSVTYWRHNRDIDDRGAPKSIFALAVDHELMLARPNNQDEVIWRLKNVHIGSLYHNSKGDRHNDRIYLPYSPTSAPIYKNVTEIAPTNVSYLVMRNIVGNDYETTSAIYSPCYSNGISTIYFDAVNGFTTDENAMIVVEYANETCDGDSPTDANCAKPDGKDPFWYLENTKGGTEVESKWKVITDLVVLLKEEDAAEFKDVTTNQVNNGEITLNIKTGKLVNTFYRIYVNLSKIEQKKGIRFRIRRTKATPGGAGFASNYFILVDNILVSPPAMSAKLDVCGTSDEDASPVRRGKQALGWVGGLSKPLPSITDDELRGRAKVTYQTTPGFEVDKSKFFASARLKYRWRYLNQYLGDWRTVYFDVASLKGNEGEVISTAGPLEFDFRGTTCDVEWYYDYTLQSAAYVYCDYSGCGVEKPVGDYLEGEHKKISRFIPTDERLASGGTDWFARLREGKSDWEQMQVYIESKKSADESKFKSGYYPMALADNGMWRAQILVPTEAAGETCTFKLVGNNKYGDSADEAEIDSMKFGLVEDAATECEIPSSIKLIEKGKDGEVTLDKTSGYLEFKMSDEFLNCQIGHVEYQNFNNWNDAHSTNGVFFADYYETNSVNEAKMKEYRADMSNWPVFNPTNDFWNMRFPFDYEKEYLHHAVKTTNDWYAEGITFVSEKFAEHDYESGMAGKLLGNGNGYLEFTKTTPDRNMPQGIEKIEFRARLGQSHNIKDAVSRNKSSSEDDNYMFFAPVTMSHRTSDNDEHPKDMAVGASVSMFGYHDENGGYELRAERQLLGKKILLSLYKWESINGNVEPGEPLQQKEFDVSMWNTDAIDKIDKDGNVRDEQSRRYNGMFISFKTEYEDEDRLIPISTKIVGGITTSQYVLSNNFDKIDRPWEPFTNQVSYAFIAYEDTDDPFGWGAYGVSSKDCPARFMMPAHLDHPITYDLNNSGKQTMVLLLEDDFVEGPDGCPYHDDRRDMKNGRKWSYPDVRGECFTNNLGKAIGIGAPTNLTQTIKLDLRDSIKTGDQAAWKNVDEKQLTGNYGFKAFTYDLKIDGDWDIRFTTGLSNATDVVVDDIVQYEWTAYDSSYPKTVDTDSWADEYIFSQVIVKTNGYEVVTNSTHGIEMIVTNELHCVDLVPARAEPKRPISIRSKVIDGLGKFSFDYFIEPSSTNAEVWVQVATNAVRANLNELAGYNNSIRSTDVISEQTRGVWLNWAKYSVNAEEPYKLKVGEPDTKTVYLGWHDNENRPVQGAFRIFVPTNVVNEAKIAMTNEFKTIDYGRIRIDRVLCTDEPGIDERSWRGWNMRTIGDADDEERRMNLFDMKLDDGTPGMVCALNNSNQDVHDNNGKPLSPSDEKLCSGLPAIYAPTMKPADPRRGVGSVEFKARLYSTNNVPETAGAGKIVIYGSNSSIGDEWKPLATNEVTSSVFSNFVWTAHGSVYKAIKFEISDAVIGNAKEKVDRVVIDEIIVGEKVPPEINILYARPFRQNLFEEKEIGDIMSPSEQPLAGENWGVQTRLSLKQLTDDIDVEKGFKVYLSYYQGKSPWGYKQWEGRGDAVKNIELTQVGEPTNLIFRSVGKTKDALVPPARVGGEVVQFIISVDYWTRDGVQDSLILNSDFWQQPDWFYPLNYNLDNGGYSDDSKFSAYTVLDTVSPGRAWINEVNWFCGKDDDGNQISDKQFIELCVPASVDMTGWQIRLTGVNIDGAVKNMVILGSGDIPAKKNVTANCVNGYEFMVFKSPNSKLPEADASWYKFNIGNSVKNGTLDGNYPFQFELIRPSGIIEHQIVIEGTNTYRSAGFTTYDGTNLVDKLNANDIYLAPSLKPKRFFAGADIARLADGETRASIGVVGGEASEDTSYWPGGSNTWKEALHFTPGKINEGQTIPEGWFMPSSGTNSWVYFSLQGSHLSQKVGDETSPSLLAIVQQGKSTNVHYHVDNWYEMSVTTNGELAVEGKNGDWDYTIYPTGTVYVSGIEAPRRDLAEKFGLTADNRYTGAVRRWLEEEYGDYDIDDIRLARCKGLCDHAAVSWMSLTDMYWLGIPPVASNEMELAMNNGTNWWLRTGVRNLEAKTIYIQNGYDQEGPVYIPYTNRQVGVVLYASNACSQVKWAPKRLRGMGYEDSSTFDYGKYNWTSETFKVYGRLDLSPDTKYVPFRIFTFNELSFTGENDEHPFSALIDILDPFQSATGRAYHWDQYPNNKAYFDWKINTDYYPLSTEILKADSTYKSTPSE